MASTSSSATANSSTMASTFSSGAANSSTIGLTSSSASTSRSPPPPPSPQPQASPRNPLELEEFDFQDHVKKLLHTEDLIPLQEAILEYAETRDDQFLRIFKSFVRLYPESFCLQLNEMLQFQPSLQIRTEIFSLLRFTLRESMTIVSSSVLDKLKLTILNSLIIESEDFLFASLCELIGLVADRLYRQYPVGGWDELLGYFISMISSYSESNKTKGFFLLTEFPIQVARNTNFWLNQGIFDVAYTTILKSTYWQDGKLNGLVYDAAVSLLTLSKYLHRTDVSEILLPMLLDYIVQHREDEGLVTKLKRLVDLVTLDDGNIVSGKHREVFWSMVGVAEMEDASDELRRQSVNIIKQLDMKSVYEMESVIKNFTEHEIQRVVALALNLMGCFIDNPIWFNVYSDDCKTAGFTENFNYGQFLFKFLCLYGHDSVFIPTAIDMLTEKCASHVRWRVRNSAMYAVGSMAEYCFTDMGMIHHFEKVAVLVLNSLDELNHRVLWATMHAITLFKCKELLINTQYHKKFLEKLVAIAKCHSCARVQSYAIITIRHLENTCGLDRTSLSDTDTCAPTIALQDSNVARHSNLLTRKLDELEGKVNAASKFFTINRRSLLTADEVNNILFGPRPGVED